VKIRDAALYLLAGLAGWGGMDLCTHPNETHHSSVLSRVATAPVLTALHSVQRPGTGSTGVSRIAEILRDLPDDEGGAARARIETWPPGAIREFGLALFPNQKSGSPAGGPVPPGNDDGAAKPNRFRELAEDMAAGRSIPLDRSGYGDHTLMYWVATDPSSATDAILKMSRGAQRREAVDIAAEAMSAFDPPAAMEFILKSGEQELSVGASRAWAQSVIGNPSPEHIGQLMGRLSPAQQNSLFEAFAKSVPEPGTTFYNLPWTEFDQMNQNARDPLHRSDLELIAASMLEAGSSSPGLEAFLRNLTKFPQLAANIRESLESLPGRTPAQEAALEVFSAEELKRRGASGDFSFLDVAGGSVLNASVSDRAAPVIIKQLVHADRLPDAVHLLGNVRDPNIRRSALESLLPAWMEADPVAAKAAYEAVPFTALERERWDQHPAFRARRP
jgi:hypothetical protein